MSLNHETRRSPCAGARHRRARVRRSPPRRPRFTVADDAGARRHHRRAALHHLPVRLLEPRQLDPVPDGADGRVRHHHAGPDRRCGRSCPAGTTRAATGSTTRRTGSTARDHKTIEPGTDLTRLPMYLHEAAGAELDVYITTYGEDLDDDPPHGDRGAWRCTAGTPPTCSTTASPTTSGRWPPSWAPSTSSARATPAPRPATSTMR